MPTDSERLSTTRPVGRGLVVGIIGAIPLFGPALVAGCAACVGAGAAAGAGAAVGASAVFPSPWWIAATVVLGLGIVAFELVRSRKCSVRRSPIRTLTVLFGVAALVFFVTSLVIAPWVNSFGPGPLPGPTSSSGRQTLP